VSVRRQSATERPLLHHEFLANALAIVDKEGNTILKLTLSVL